MKSRAQGPRVQPLTGTAGLRLDKLERSLEAEIRGSLARILGRHKAESLAAECDRKRSTIYAWAGHPGQVPVQALTVLIDMDPDPEIAARFAGHILKYAADRALARAAEGGAVLILESLSAPVQADEESIRRATGTSRGQEGND